MIVGIGTDICEIKRIERTKDAFRSRFFTPAELEYAGGRAERLAGAFAAKEAFVKALGTGFEVFELTSIEILHDDRGAPHYRLSGWAEEAAKSRGIERVFLSISHDFGTAIAFCVAERSEIPAKES